MPDIIEENEGEGNSAIQRRVNALVLARAAAAAARGQNQNNNNNNNNNGGRPVAVPEGNAPAVAPAGVGGGAAAGAAAANGGGGAGAEAASIAAAAEVHSIASNLARLAGVDVRPMFRRLGVRRGSDIRYIREKDLDGIPRITPIQKRKVWAVLKYVAIDGCPPLTPRTTLSEIAKTLNANKKKEKESNSSNNATTSTSAQQQQQQQAASTTRTLAVAAAAFSSGSSVTPMVQVSKLEEFDGHHSNWLLWKRKTVYQLASTNLGALMQDGEQGKSYAKKNSGHDFLFFNLLAQAIVSGSAQHLIPKAEQLAATSTSASNNNAASSGNNNNSRNDDTKKSQPSGRVLWNFLLDEYSKGPMAFWILSDARQTLQKLTLVGSSSSAATTITTTITSATHGIIETDNNNSMEQFVTRSAHDYVDRFRSARDTLAEYKQELPDAFLAANFVEHVYDDKFDTVKKQLLRDVSTKNLSLEDCIKELLMSDHMLRIRQQNNMGSSIGNSSNIGGGGGDVQAIVAAAAEAIGSRKRQNPDEPEEVRQDDDGKRQRMDEAEVAAEAEVHDEDMMNHEPDEATS